MKKTHKHGKITRGEVDFVTDSKSAMLREAPRYTWITIYLLFFLVIVTIFWAYHYPIDVYATAQGKVVSSANLQVIQNLEGGIVSAIEVNEGDVVEKGQVLVRLDDTRFSADYKRDLAKFNVLTVDMIRLDAEAEGKDEIAIPEDLVKSEPELVRHAVNLFKKNRAALEKSLSILNENKALVEQELRIIRPLAAKGALSKLEKIRLERELNNINVRINEKRATTREDARRQLNKVKAEAKVLQEQIAASRDRMQRTILHSPVPGTVNNMYITTIGEVITPGMKIMEIVPLDDQLTIEVKVAPSDIGFIHPGQTASLRISAYDYSVYGTLDATVKNIAADVVTDNEGRDFYEVKLESKQNHLGTDADPLPIRPGMSVTASIRTDKRSLLSYIVRPFIDLQQTAFQKR